jgi:hypothetical protein
VQVTQLKRVFGFMSFDPSAMPKIARTLEEKSFPGRLRGDPLLNSRRVSIRLGGLNIYNKWLKRFSRLYQTDNAFNSFVSAAPVYPLRGWRVVGIFAARGATDESDKPSASAVAGRHSAPTPVSAERGQLARRRACAAKPVSVGQHNIIPLRSQEFHGTIDIVAFSITWGLVIGDFRSRNTIDLSRLPSSAAAGPPFRAVNSRDRKMAHATTCNSLRRCQAIAGSVATGSSAPTLSSRDTIK